MTVGEILVRFGAETSGFSGAIADMIVRLDSFGAKALAVGAIAAVALGVAAVAAGVAAAKMAGDFQAGVTRLYTTAGELHSNLQMVGDGILAMAGQVGTSAQTLVQAMYFVESAGFHGAAGLDVLRIAAMGSKAENSDLTSVVKTLVSTLNSYAGTGLTAAVAMNTLIAATSQGHMTLNDLSGAISNVLPATARFGISLIDTTGAIAEMTKQGDNASSAATHLRQMILALESPSRIGAAALRSVGLTTQQVSDEMKVSLPATLQMITDAVGKRFPVGSAAYNQAIRDIAGGSRQMMGFLELTGAHMKDYQQIVDDMTASVRRGGQSIMGWADVQANFNFKMDQARASLGALGIALGTQLLPTLTRMAGAVTPVLIAFASWVTSSHVVENSIQGLVSWFGQFGPVVAQVGAAFANLGSALAPVASHFQQAGTAGQVANLALSGLRLVIVELATGLAALINGLAALVRFGTQIASAFQAASAATHGFHDAIAMVQTVLASLGVLLAVGATGFLLWQGAVMLAGLMSAMSVTSIFALVPALIANGVAAAGSAIAFVAGLVPAFIATTAAAIGTAAAVVAATWPFLLIGAAIALAVVGLILLYTNCAPVRAAVASLVTTAVQLWNTLMSNLAPAFAQVGAALGRLGAAFGEMLAALRPAAPLVMVLGAVLGGVLAIALGLVIGALMGIVTGLGYFIAGLTMVLTGIIMVFTGIITFIAGFFTVIVGICTLNTATIQQGFASMGAGISQIVSGALTAIEGLFVAVFGTIFGIVVGFVQGVITFFEGLYQALVGGSIVPDMCNGILNAFQSMVSVVTAVISAFVGVVTAIFFAMVAIVAAVFQTMLAVVSGIVSALVALCTGDFQGFQSAVIGIFTALQSGAIAIFNAFESGVVSVASALVSGVMGIFNALPGNVQGVFNSMKDAALGVLNSLASLAFNAAANVGSAIVGGLNSMLGAITGAAQNIAGTIASFLPHSPAEQGPLARLDEFGPAVPAMFAAGIVAGIPQVQAAVSMMVSPVPQAVASVAAAPSGPVSRASGGSSGMEETNTLLRQLIRTMEPGRRLTDDELIHAVGARMADRVQQYRR